MQRRQGACYREVTMRESSRSIPDGSPRICRAAAGGRPSAIRRQRRRQRRERQSRPRGVRLARLADAGDRRDARELRAQPARHLLRRVRRRCSRAEPARQLRSAAQYLRDVFDHFGTEHGAHAARADDPLEAVRLPVGRRQGRAGRAGRGAGAVYRLVANFAREGRTNRLILLHGPNGSAKSTFVACLQRALEHYSTLDEGALYRFNWIFPSQKLTKGGIGFGGGHRVGRRRRRPSPTSTTS